MIIAGTSDGIVKVEEGSRALEGREVTALARDGDETVAIAGGNEIVRTGATGTRLEATIKGLAFHCLLVSSAGLLAGTSKAHLARVEDGAAVLVPGFDAVPTRADWYTPWSGPPDVRSLAEDVSGALFANVHVGGILVSSDGGAHWAPTMLDIDADVHQVVVHPVRAGVVYAATAYGLATSEDGGEHWETTSDGLDESYCRAVAIAGDTLLISGARSHRGERAALYRRPLASTEPFERCSKGLPDAFGDNIDTGCVAAHGREVAFGTAGGEVFRSENEGATWDRVAEGLPAVRCLVVA